MLILPMNKRKNSFPLPICLLVQKPATVNLTMSSKYEAANLSINSKSDDADMS